MRRSVSVLLTTLVGTAVAAGPAVAATSSGSSASLGGPRLAGNGVVVDRSAPALPEGITASSYLLADLDSGQVLAAKDAHGRYAPASTLKTLTMLALIPELDRDELVTPTFDDVNVEGSKVGLVDDVAYPVHELFTALMTVSGNDAANALATAAGGPEAAAELMNDAAEGLQARDTRAVNPHGLDAEGQVSSAYDLALIARAGMADPQFAAYAATVKSSVSAPGGARIEVYTKNRLLKDYEGALGIKNGYTSSARASFVGAAERDGRRLVVTLMRADPRVADEAAKLLDWGFDAAAGVAPVGRLVDPLPEAAPLGPEVAAPAAALAPAGVASSGEGAGGGGVTAALAGAGLAAAAVLSVRHRPAPGRVPAGAAVRPSVPAQVPPARMPARPLPRTVAARVGPAVAERPRRTGVA